MPEDVNPLKEDGTPKSPEEIAQEQAARAPATPAPGSQTDPALLLKSLQEEREKRKLLEDRIELLEQNPGSSDIFSEEGKALQQQIQESNSKIEALTNENAKKDIFIEHPILKEKTAEFETFLADPENKGMSMKTAAKAFLVENGLLDAPRRGLEKPTGGDRIPPSTKMSVEDVKTLRETNFKKYQEMLAKGEIQV